VVCASYRYIPKLADVLLCAVSCSYNVSVEQHQVGGGMVSNRLILCGRQRSWPILVYYSINSLSLEELRNSCQEIQSPDKINLLCTGCEPGAFQLHWTLHARIYCCPSRETEAASCKVIIGRAKSVLNLTIVLFSDEAKNARGTSTSVRLSVVVFN
jgi:hypothetical protein